jgi:hypothetical protein
VTEIAALVPASAGLGTRGSGLGTQVSGSVSPNPYPVSPSPKGWKANDFKREFNKIVKGDPRFKELK